MAASAGVAVMAQPKAEMAVMAVAVAQQVQQVKGVWVASALEMALLMVAAAAQVLVALFLFVKVI